MQKFTQLHFGWYILFHGSEKKLLWKVKWEVHFHVDVSWKDLFLHLSEKLPGGSTCFVFAVMPTDSFYFRYFKMLRASANIFSRAAPLAVGNKKTVVVDLSVQCQDKTH